MKMINRQSIVYGSKNYVDYLGIVFGVRNVEDLSQSIVEVLHSFDIVFEVVPLYNHLFDPFPSNLQSFLRVVSIFASFGILSLSTKALHHPHELRYKVCDSVRVFQYVLLDNVKFFELWRRILLVSDGLGSLVSNFSRFTALIGPKVRNIPSLLGPMSIGLSN